LIINYIPLLLDIFCSIIETEHAKGVKNDIIQALHFLKVQHAATLLAALRTLPQDRAEHLLKFFSIKSS